MTEPKYYPLTTSQQILMYADKFCFIRSWLNIAAVVDFHCEIDEHKMLQAMAISLMRSPSASVRLHKGEDKQLTQYFSNELPTGIELIDLSGLTEEEFEKTVTKWAQTPFPHKALDTQLFNFKLLRRPGGLCSMFVSVYHMSFDSYTVMSTVRDIMATYDALMNGTELPKEPYSPVPLFEAEGAYYASERYQKDKEFWKNYFPKDDEPFFVSLNGKNCKHRKKDKRYGIKNALLQNKTFHENLRFPAELVSRVNAQAAEWRVSPQSIWHAVIHTYLSVINETDDVTLTNAVARRATLVQKRAGGTMVNPVLVRCKLDRKTATFADACQQAYRSLNNSYRHAEFMFGEVAQILMENYGMPANCGYDGFTLCYQPYFTLEKGDMPMSFRRLNNGGGACVCYLTMMPQDNSGDLWGNYEYIKGYYEKETILKFHDALLKITDAALKNPEKSLAELAKGAI